MRVSRAVEKGRKPLLLLRFLAFIGLHWIDFKSPRQELNLYLALRRRLFYPLNYEERQTAVTSPPQGCEVYHKSLATRGAADIKELGAEIMNLLQEVTA